MGTSQNQRWELDYIKVDYKGGYIESDFYVQPKEASSKTLKSALAEPILFGVSDKSYGIAIVPVAVCAWKEFVFIEIYIICINIVVCC